MKKSKKIIAIVVAAVILLVAIGLTLYFCLWHNKQNPPEVGDGDNQGNFTYSTPSGIGIEASKTELNPGDVFTVTIKVSTSRVGLYWQAVDIVIGPMIDQTTVSTDIATNFELVKLSIGEPFKPNNGWQNNSSGQFDSDRGTAGIRISLACMVSNMPASTEPLIITAEIKVKDTALPTENFKFGITEKRTNMIQFTTSNYSADIYDFANGTTEKNTDLYETESEGIKVQTLDMSIKAKNN